MKKNAKSLLPLLFVICVLPIIGGLAPHFKAVDLSDLPSFPISQHAIAVEGTEDYIDSQSNIDSHADHGTHDVFADLQGYEGTMDYFLEGNTGTSLVNYENYIDATSNIDSHADHGTHSSFPNLQAYDSTYDTMTEANTGGTGTNTHDYVDNTSNLHAPSDIGTHSSFPEEQDFDAVYDTLTEADAGTAATNYNDYVDSASSNIDSHADHGTHSNFANQQSAPDTVSDQITEANVPLSDVVFGQSGTGSSYITIALNVAEGSVWTTNGAGGTLTDAHVYCRGSSGTVNVKLVIYVHSTLAILTNGISDVLAVSTTAAWKTFVWSGTKPVLAAGTAYILTVIPAAAIRLYYYGTSAVGHQDATNSYTTPQDMGTATHVNYEYRMYIHMVQTNYELDIEEAWTAAQFSETNEELCIRTTSWLNEAVKVQVWNGAWNTVIASLVAASWNNVSITTYLTSATLYIRFQGNTETLDIVQGYWNIDSVLLHCWSAAYVNYRLDLEVGWTTADYDEINEYLCLRGGTQNAEALMVDVWSGAAWVNVIADVTGDISAPEWNNVSVSSYLTSSAFEIRFIDTTQSSDSAQGTWQVEAVLLHVWGNAVNYELDLEMDWTTAQYSETYEYIDIKTATFSGSPAESLYLDVWYSSAWQRIGAVSANTWNNLSVNTYLTSATLYMRLLGQTETTDTAQNTFQVDCVILHCWTPAAPLYELDLEGQWTAADFDEANEYLCIFVGTQDAEACKVDVWNGAGWTNLIADLTASVWNNVSVASYLTSVTFTIRFLGGSESSDTTQSGWNVDCALLHTWTGDNAPVNSTLPTCSNLNDTDNMYPVLTKYIFTSAVSDVDGSTDISYVELSLVTDPVMPTVLWTWRFTVATSLFTEEYNPTYTALDPSGSSHAHSDANHIEITWKGYIEWAHTDYPDADFKQFVQDVHSPSDTDYNTLSYDVLTSVSIWLDAVEVTDSVAEHNRGNIDGSLTTYITEAEWASDGALHPDDDLIDAWVICADVSTSPWQLTYTESTGYATGTAKADDVVGSDIYTFKVVQQGAGAGGAALDTIDHSYIADRAKLIDLTTTNGRIGVTETASCHAELRYEYDNAVIGLGATVTVDGLSATYNSVTYLWDFGESKSTTQKVTYDGPVTISGDTYGVSSVDLNSQTLDQIWDRAIIDSFYTNDTRASTTQHIVVYLTGHLEYDGHPLGSGDAIQIDPAASNMTWDAGDARFEYDAWSDVGDKRTYSLTALTEATYGIKKFQMPSTFGVWWDYIIRSSYSVTDARDDIGDQINVTQYLYYWGDSAPLTTGTVTFNGVSAAHVGGGYWRISRTQSSVMSETYNDTQCAGDDTYGVYSESGSWSTTVIWDCVIWTSVSVSDHRVDLTDDVNITFHLHLDYDDEDVTSGTVYIEGILATNLGGGDWQITDSHGSVCNTTYDAVTSVSGITYNITAIGSGPSDTAVWDKLTVQTTVADDSRVNIGANSEIRVTLWREYDDTYVEGGTVRLNGTDMSWDAVNSWWDLSVTKSTVSRWVYVVSFANDTTYDLQELDTNGQSVPVIFDRVQVQNYSCSDSFVNTGAWLPFYVQLFYDFDNAYVTDGSVTVNGETATYYEDGLWLVNVTEATSQSRTFDTVACSGNVYGISEEDQNGQSQTVYWDRVLITLTSTNDNRTGTGQYALISVTGEFEDFSHSLGAGDTVTVDGQAMTWNATSGHFELSVNRATVGNYSFFVNSTAEATYGITALSLEGHSTYVTFDKVHLVLSSNMGWTVVGYNVTISGAGGHYEYDSAPWTGTFDIDSMGAYPHYDTAQNKTVQASSVTDPTYGITTVINDPCYVVWDDALISSTAYFWTQYSIEQVWLLWASGTWTWEINGTTIDTGADGYCIIQSHMNGTEDDWAIVNSGDIGDLIIGSFNPSWYYANVTIAVETTINGRAYDWAVWSAVLSVDIMHTIQITGSGMDVEDVWITFIIHSNWNNATFTVWDNDTVVGYSQWEGWYQVAKPTVVGLHNYTLLVNGTHSGSYSNQTKNFAESDSWVWLNFKYTVNPVELSFDEVSFNQNNESVMVTGRVWTSSTTLYYTVYEATLGWTSGMISGVTSGSWLSWMWDKSSVTSTSNFTVTMTDSTYNVTFRGFYLRIAGNQWITYGSSVTEDHRTYVQNSSIIYSNPPGFFIDQGTATILAVGGVIIAMFALMVSKQIVKGEILKGIRKGLSQ